MVLYYKSKQNIRILSYDVLNYITTKLLNKRTYNNAHRLEHRSPDCFRSEHGTDRNRCM
jgi:hypothetical protein